MQSNTPSRVATRPLSDHCVVLPGKDCRAMPNFESISLADLVLSPQNVRKTPPTEAEQNELKASIQAHGLITGLTVQPVDTDRYAVIAGGRRLTALQALADAGLIEDTHPVPCLISDGTPGEISLAENIERAAMSPLDEFEAFNGLAEQGMSPADIARRFGCTELLVNKRLRLARVASEIRTAYRDGEISLDIVMAFTITDDQARQRTIWEGVNQGGVYASQVRRLLSEDKLTGASGLCRLVGQEAYEAAGGTITTDLFTEDDGVLFDSPALVMELAQQRLDEQAQHLKADEGWSWVETDLDANVNDARGYGRIQMAAVEPTPEQVVERDGLRATIAALEARAETEEGWTEEIVDSSDEAEELLDDLEEALWAFAAEDKARAGCLVCVHYDGTLNITRGLVRAEDRAPESGVASAIAEARGPKGYSAALLAELTHARLGVVQDHMAADFGCAFDVMLFGLAKQVAGAAWQRRECPLDMHVNKTLPRVDAPVNTGDGDGKAAFFIKGIPMDWLDLDPVQGFERMSEKLSLDDKQRLFAYCVSLSLKGHLADGDDLHDAIGARLGVDVAAHWRPTKDNFFGRINKAQSLEIARDVLGEQWAASRAGEKKGVVADTLEVIFSGDRTAGVTQEQAALAARWLPGCMAFSCRETTLPGSAFPIDGVAPCVPSEDPAVPESPQTKGFLEDHIQIIAVGGGSSTPAKQRPTPEELVSSMLSAEVFDVPSPAVCDDLPAAFLD